MKRTPLRPSGSPERRTPLAPRNAARQKKRADEGLVYGPYHDFVGTLPCMLRGKARHHCWGLVKGHHLKSVGAGGKDAANEVPLCERAHDAAHLAVPSVFEAFYRVSLSKAAADCWRRWTERGAA